MKATTIIFQVIFIIILSFEWPKICSSSDDVFVCEEWSTWAKSFPACPYSNDSFHSPINIISDHVELANSAALKVYPNYPNDQLIKAFKFSTNFGVDNNGQNGQVYILEVSKIGKEIQEFIEESGTRRYFLNFKILLTKSKLNPEVSSHQINGERFPMELVFLFEELNKAPLSTVVHVLVKISETDNPMFFPVIEAANKYQNSKKDSTQKTILEKRRHEKQNVLNSLTRQRRNITHLIKEMTSKNVTDKLQLQKISDMDSQSDTLLARIKKLIDEVETIHIDLQGHATFESVFQPSWLFPLYGGYYTYESSYIFPILPMCNYNSTKHPNPSVILLEHPIEISQSQLDILVNIKLPETAKRPGLTYDKCFPPMRPLKNRLVKYNPKNLQYIKDDHVHLISKSRKEVKEDRAKDGGAIIGPCFKYIIIILTIHFLLEYN